MEIVYLCRLLLYFNVLHSQNYIHISVVRGISLEFNQRGYHLAMQHFRVIRLHFKIKYVAF